MRVEYLFWGDPQRSKKGPGTFDVVVVVAVAGAGFANNRARISTNRDHVSYEHPVRDARRSARIADQRRPTRGDPRGDNATVNEHCLKELQKILALSKPWRSRDGQVGRGGDRRRREDMRDDARH